ncbi:MAG: hypothetical protein VR67_05470 [Peptococcaceae bacterium BRH_c8a]|nr:MAG: hypothetical protein VR67_05470 [Peptococcaceae bacterium BRH_c8a]
MDYIYVNDLIEWVVEDKNGLCERVLWVNPSINEVIVINIELEKGVPYVRSFNEIKMGLEEGYVTKVQWVSDKQRIPEKELSQALKNKRDKAWKIIEPLVCDEPDIYNASLRGILVNEACSTHGCQKRTIYRYLRMYWQNGKTKNALLPKYNRCGAPGKERNAGNKKKRGRPPRNGRKGINITSKIKSKILSGVGLFYDRREKRPLTVAYVKTMGKFFSLRHEDVYGEKTRKLLPKDEMPTFGQFRYWYIKEIDLRKSLEAREGLRRVQLRHRERLGDSTLETFGPGSRYQIDATIGDVYLVSYFNRHWIIGRPVIYVVIDVFSRMIAGLYVGLEGPSWIGAMMALANAVSDKKDFCASYGIEITDDQWPCAHLPELLTADRGVEYMGDKPKHLKKTLRVDLEHLPPYRADWKAIVERYFGIANEQFIHFIPGSVRKHERGERDYRLDATLNLYEFTALMIELILHHNNRHRMEWYNLDEFAIKEQIQPYPIELWKWGLKNRIGRLRKESYDIVRLNLMPSGTARVTDMGIKFKMPGIQISHAAFYTCEKALKEDWFIQARNKGSWPIEVSYDPRLVDYIYIRLDRGRGFEKCRLKDKHSNLMGKRWEDFIDMRERRIQDSQEAYIDDLQAKIDLQDKTDATVNKAKKEKQQDNRSKSQRVKSIREHRKLEKEFNSQNEAFELDKTEADKNGTVVGQGRFTIKHEDDNPPADYYDILEKIKEENL